MFPYVTSDMLSLVNLNYFQSTAYGECDGVRCTDNAECVNYRCLCKKGYIGNGY